MLHGWRGGNQKIFRRSSSSVLARRIVRLAMPCLVQVGWRRCDLMRSSPPPTSYNLWSFGPYSPTSNFNPTQVMKSVGSLRRMESTRQNRPTRCNSWEPFFPPWRNRFGSLGLLPRQSFLLGLPIKIGFGRRTGWQEEDGPIAAFALFVSKRRRPPLTSLCIAATLDDYGT